jgi:hypothetical protein
MRAISQYGEYGIQIRAQRQQGMGDGSIQITTEPIYAKFLPLADAAIFEVEVEQAMKVFPFKGRYQHVDEATPVDVAYRLSVFDTEVQNYDEATRLLVEAELIRLEPLTPDFFIATETPVEAPYPAWDTSTTPAFQLVGGLVDMGFNLQDALAYERGFGPRREDVIEALEAVIADKAQDVEVISA